MMTQTGILYTHVYMPHPLLIICHTHSLYSIIIIGMPGMPPGMPPGMRPMAPGLLAAPGMMPPVPPGSQLCYNHRWL